MTSLPNQHNIASQSQAGVSLLLAVLVLSAITAIAFSAAGIITSEIRTSGDVVRTEPALYGVQGVTEEAFYQYGRATSSNLNVTSCAGGISNICTLNGVTMNSAIRQYDTSPELQILQPGQTIKYPLVSPANPTSFSQPYVSASVLYLDNGSPATLTVNQIRYGPDGGTATTSYSPARGSTLSLGPFDNNAQYELTLTNNSGSDSALVQIDVKKSSGVTEVPLFGKNVLNVSAGNFGLTRTYTVNIPYGAPPLVSTQFRYLRVNSSSNSWVAWAEIQALNSTGTVLTPVSASASSTYSTFTPNLVYDGSTGTFWNAGSPSGNITLDYGAVVSATQIKLYTISTPDPATATHVLSVSTDGVNFTTLQTFSGSIPSSAWLQYP